MRDPDIRGAGNSKAWRQQLEGRVTAPGAPPDWQGHVAGWLIYQPGVNLVFSWWALYVVHLRPIAGAPPAKLHFDGATHELGALVIDPEFAKTLEDPESEAIAEHFCSPHDQCLQFGGCDDDQAREIGELVVRDVMSGRSSLDSDWRGYWKAVIPKTVEHVLTGGTHAGVKA